MKRPLYLLFALFLVAALTACGSDDSVTFNVDRFFDQLVDDPPQGLVMVLSWESDSPNGDPYESIHEIKLGTGPIRKNEFTDTVRDAYGESSIQKLIVGETRVFRTIINGRESGWIKLSADDVSDGVLGGVENYDSGSWFGDEPERRQEWTSAGDAPCRVGRCFLLEQEGESTRSYLVDKSTYDVVGYFYAEEDTGGPTPELVNEIFNWGEDPGIRVPPGQLAEGTARDLEDAMIAASRTNVAAENSAVSTLPDASTSSRPPPIEDPAAAAEFDHDRFLRESFPSQLRGYSMSIDIPPDSIAPDSPGFSVESRQASGPIPDSETTLTFHTRTTSATLHSVSVGDDIYFRTILDGEPSPWTHVPLDAQTAALAQSLRTSDTIATLTARFFDRDDWVVTGMAPCRDRECFVLEHAVEPPMAVLIDRATYVPVQMIVSPEDPGSTIPDVVAEVLSWDEPEIIEAPTGDFATGTYEDLEAAMLVVFEMLTPAE
jgi:hypothetical protein